MTAQQKDASSLSQDAPFSANHIAFVGLGLIGSSIARALNRYSLAKYISVYDINPQYRAQIRDLKLADNVSETLEGAVQNADIIILCAPVKSYGDIANSIAPHLKKGAIVTDVGSVKASVIADITPHIPAGVHFVPGHPIAGTEKSGPEHGFAHLFADRWCILTPPDGTEPAAIQTITRMWEAIGSTVEIMAAAHHDKVLAITSHVPHLIAYTIVGTASDLEKHMLQEVIKYSASGFRDFTRIAGSDPIMWRDIFLNNKEAVLEILQRFSEDLSLLQRAIRWDEADTLENLFRRTRDIRTKVVDAKQA